jgi:hypothetical protein
MQFNRRAFLCAGSASMLSAFSRFPANAQFEEITVPCVEWLAIRIVAADGRQQIDNSIGSARALQTQDATIHVQSASGTQMRSFLIDPCADPRALLERIDRLRIDLSSLDALVLSGDSEGKREALTDFLGATDGYLKRDIEVVTRAYGRRMKTSSFAFDATERACVDDAGQSRIVGGQLLVVGSRRSAIRPVGSDNISLVGYQLGPQSPADSPKISANFVLLQKGLVVVTSNNESAVDCVKAAQAASGCCDVHAIVGLNIGIDKEPARAQSVLAELLKLGPAHIIVSAEVADVARSLVEPESSTKIISGLAGTRLVFR